MIFPKRWIAYNTITQRGMHEYQEESIVTMKPSTMSLPVIASLEGTKKSWKKGEGQKQNAIKFIDYMVEKFPRDNWKF